MARPEESPREPGPSAMLAIEKLAMLLGHNQNVRFEDVREDFKAVAEREHRQFAGNEIWMQSASTIADCAFLGIHPQTGEDLLEPDIFVAQFQGPGNMGQEVRTRYYQLKSDLSNRPSSVRETLK